MSMPTTSTLGALRVLQASVRPRRHSWTIPTTTVARPLLCTSGALVPLPRGRSHKVSTHLSPLHSYLLPAAIRTFTSSRPASRSEDESSLPLDDVPIVKNPTPEQTLDVFEGLAQMQYKERIKGIYTTPSQYCAAIVKTTRIIGHFLVTVDKDEFRSGKGIAPDSPIARGRMALMLTARTAHRWMQEAYPPHAPPSDEDIAEAMMYFAMANKLMDVYEAHAPDPVPEWQDICDAILLTYHYALPTLERIAGPIPKELKIYSAEISGLKEDS